MESGSAYEISTHHKKQPPPKEILEDLTAKGGDLLNRTLENFGYKANREESKLTNGEADEGSDTEQKTPREDKMDVDDLSTTPGRVTRGKQHKSPT
jgi:chromatin structure-remodeling complex subunit RSC9